MKKPYVPIYKGDWKQDQALQCCSLAAQAAWLLVLFSLDDSPAPGFLLKPSGETPTPEELARMLGRSPTEIIPLVEELERNHVFDTVTSGDVARGGLLVRLPRGKSYVVPVSAKMQGAIYSRRMVRAIALAQSKRRGDHPKSADPLDPIEPTQGTPQTSPQTLDQSDPDPDPDLPPPARTRETITVEVLEDVPLNVEPDALRAFAKVKERWNRSEKLLEIPLWDDAERTAFYANIWRPLRARGFDEGQILADCELLIERAEASDQVTAARSFKRIATKPAHLREVLSGTWVNRPAELELARAPPKTTAGQRIHQLADLATREMADYLEGGGDPHDPARDHEVDGDRGRLLPASATR